MVLKPEGFRRVPAREKGMVPYEFMLTESQERMLLCVKKGRDRRYRYLEKWDLDVATIGEVTDTGRMELFLAPEKKGFVNNAQSAPSLNQRRPPKSLK